MGRTTRSVLLAATAVGGVVAARRAATARARRREQARRAHVITVFRPSDEIRAEGRWPSPLAELGDGVDIELRPAPGDRGTEISVRSRDGAVPAGTIRRALRDTRSLVEAGDVLLPYGPSTTTPTLTNRALRKVTQLGREGGLL